MRKFELSPDCVLENSGTAIAKSLIKSSFIVGCDFKNKELILENVFHYTCKEKRLEVYSLFPNEADTQRKLKLEMAMVFVDKKDIFSEIARIFTEMAKGYDVFIVDKYNNLYTDIVYDKYGETMVLA